MKKFIKKLAKKTEGFTLVELIVVQLIDADGGFAPGHLVKEYGVVQELVVAGVNDLQFAFHGF